jgi:serine/threonine-protein kinase RsbT
VSQSGARRPENEIVARILLLRRHLSELTANSLLDSALERTGLQAARLQQGDIPKLMPALERGARLFMRSQSEAEETVAALLRMASAPTTAARPGSGPLPPAPRPEAIRPEAARPEAVRPDASRLPRSDPESLWSRSEPPTVRRTLPDAGAAARPEPLASRPEPLSARATAARRTMPDLGGWAPEARTEPRPRPESPAEPRPRPESPAEARAAREAPRAQPAQVQGPSLVVVISREDEIVRARGEARRMAERLGATVSRQTQLATAVSELARNIFLYAGGRGAVELAFLAPPLRGVDVVARDQGPGIADIALVLDGNYQSKLGMGLGLRGVRRLASYFEVNSVVGAGTVVRAQFRIDPNP